MSEIEYNNTQIFGLAEYEQSLLDKIRMIVEFDFNIPYIQMNRTNQIRFEKQTNRLFGACM